MTTTRINRSDRDALRHQLQFHEGCFEVALGCLRDGGTIDGDTRSEIDGALELLDYLGWEMEGSKNRFDPLGHRRGRRYTIPDTTAVRRILRQMHETEVNNVDDEEVGELTTTIIAACEKILGRFEPEAVLA